MIDMYLFIGGIIYLIISTLVAFDASDKGFNWWGVFTIALLGTPFLAAIMYQRDKGLEDMQKELITKQLAQIQKESGQKRVIN